MLIRDSLSYFLSRLIPAAAGLLGTALYVNMAGPDAYGRFALLLVATSVAASFAGGWLNQAILRMASESSRDAGAHAAILIAGFASCLALTVAATAAGLFGLTADEAGMDATFLAWVVAIGGAMVVYNVRLCVLQASMAPAAVTRLETVRALLFLSLPAAALAVWNQSYAALALGCALSFLIPLVGLRGRVPSRTEFPQAVAVARRMFRFGWPLSLWLAVMLAFPLVDRAFIQVHLGFDDVGIYAALYDLVVRGFALVFAPILLAAHPRIMEQANRGDVTWRATLRLALVLQIAVFIPALAACLFLAGPIIEEMIPGIDRVAIEATMLPLALAAFVWQVALLMHKPLEIAERTGAMLLFLLSALSVHTLLCGILLPSLQLAGAAWAMLASGVTYLLLCAGSRAWRDAAPATKCAGAADEP